MPHLSPFSWMLAPLLFWTFFFLILASTWWSYTPSIHPPSPISSISTSSPWSWA